MKYADVMYKISDSDVIQIHRGQSSVFCDRHFLKMNTTFSAFQMKGTPEISNKRKHIRLKKSMILADDTLEYWGFYLLKGATVELLACSLHKGSKILVVTGDRMLNTCGLLEGYKHKKSPPRVENQGLLVTVNQPEDLIKNNVKQAKTDSSKISHKDDTLTENSGRVRRNIKDIHNPNTILDTGVNHGGNSLNSTTTPQDPVSSFEKSLHECFHDKMLINNLTFPNSMLCNSTEYLEKTITLKVSHEVLVDGYYYYIFYSDQGDNEIHGIFDIYKPTFQYVNNSASKVCINKTRCEFNVDFLSDELVIVEKPTKAGLQNEESDSSILVSVCHPRVSVYILFPIAVLLLILLFAFL